MSAVSSREKNMLLIAVVAVLYAVAALCYKKQSENWKTTRRLYTNAQKKFQEEKDLIAVTREWDAKYEQLRDLMPVFPYEKDVDTHWLNIMDSTATQNGLVIARRQTNKEVEVGDVYELPIDCKDWEGTLESLVKFLFELHKKGAMLDVRQLFIRPSSKPGYLKGTFTLYCAYMRGDVEKQKPVAPDAAGSGAPGGAAVPEAAPAAAPAVAAPEAAAMPEPSEAPAAAADAGQTNPPAPGVMMSAPEGNLP